MYFSQALISFDNNIPRNRIIFCSCFYLFVSYPVRLHIFKHLSFLFLDPPLLKGGWTRKCRPWDTHPLLSFSIFCCYIAVLCQHRAVCFIIWATERPSLLIQRATFSQLLDSVKTECQLNSHPPWILGIGVPLGLDIQVVKHVVSTGGAGDMLTSRWLELVSCWPRAIHWLNVGLMLAQRRRRWANIHPTLSHSRVRWECGFSRAEL